MIRNPNMSDRAVLAVINPAAAQRDRSAFLAHTDVTMPPHDPFREGKVGVEIATAGAVTITSNHFAVNASSVPTTITQYAVSMQKIMRDGDAGEDVSQLDDPRKTLSVVKTLLARHPQWAAAGLGVAYDSRSLMYTTRPLSGITQRDAQNRLFLSEVVGLPNKDGEFLVHFELYLKVTTLFSLLLFLFLFILGTESTQARYVVTLTEVGRDLTDDNLALALENALLMYGRWDATLDKPRWVLAKNRIFTASENSRDAFSLSRFGHILAKQGWYASLKRCVNGPFLVVDLAVNAVLASGFMSELMAKAAGYERFEDFYRECSTARGLDNRKKKAIEDAIRKIRVKVTHLGFMKQARHLGPPANHPDSRFEHEGKTYTVEQYYALKARTDPRYKPVKYPYLPTVNMGSNSRKELYPAELVAIPPGEMRNHLVKEDPYLNAAMIKYAAVAPQIRIDHITNNENSVVKVLRNNSTAAAFGLNQISTEPTKVPATMLPPAKLLYGNNRVVEPEFKGEWNPSGRDNLTFQRPPVNPVQGGYLFAVMVVGNPNPNDKPTVDGMSAELARQSVVSGVKLIPGGSTLFSDGSVDDMRSKFEMVKKKGARLVMVVLVDAHDHGAVKLASDTLGLPTQCVKLTTLTKNPRGVYSNLMIKINAKLGGTNHTLKSRLEPKEAAAAAGKTFQSPPASLSWIFDKPCMLVGIDVSHPEPGADRQSMAAVVGSVDGAATKYVAHISAQSSRQEMVSDLTNAMGCLLTSFRQRNNKRMPETIVVYRDGVSEGQYHAVLRDELPQIREAVALQGFTEDAVKIAVVICTKGHNTRLVAQEGPTGEMMNVCSGLVVDSVITSPNLNEFYLNSHAAIQGTSKPCRYTLLYDQVGFKMAELQLLTYWTTFLYSRCDRAVSYATPAYYAHWASKRGKDLLAAGADAADLQNICNVCSRDADSYNMFFL